MQTVKLFISPAENQPGNYLVVVDGEGFFESVGRRVGARIRGEDEWFDDSLFGIGGTGIERVLSGGNFTISQTVPGSQLNEDWGQDEIYALVDVEGLGTFRSNTVTGDF